MDSEKTYIYTHISNLLVQDAYLSWCKIFSNNNEESHWKYLFEDHQKFKTFLFDEIKIDQTTFRDYHKSVIDFRNKWLAHLDPDIELGYIPDLKIAFDSSKALFLYLQIEFCDFEIGGPDSIETFVNAVKRDFIINSHYGLSA